MSSGVPKKRAAVKAPRGAKDKEDAPSRPAPMQRRMSRLSKEDLRKMAKMQVQNKWGTPRRLTDDELKKARSIFFDMDEDCSGDLDAEEIAKMMRKLGQNPTENEIRELIQSVDSGDMDGRLQLREFLLLFALGLDSEGAAKQSDVADCFMVFGGDPRDDDATIETNELEQKLLEDFDLDVKVSNVFGVKGAELSREDMEEIIMDKHTSASA